MKTQTNRVLFRCESGETVCDRQALDVFDILGVEGVTDLFDSSVVLFEISMYSCSRNRLTY